MEVYTGTFNKEVQMKCTNCMISLSSDDEYKVHYKSQYHRYNIKRKMLGLKPATEEQFANKKGDTAVEQNKDNNRQFQCKPCRKTFTNDGVYKQHLQSKKHQQIVKDPKTIPEKKDKKSNKRQIVPELCLFCDNLSTKFEDNLTHMQRTHGFFISQREFCKDIQGLIKYLHQKVEVGLLCIFCENKGFKQFQTAEAIRSHMKDKFHCFMNVTNGFEEFEKYYDFGRLFDERVEEQKNYRFLAGLQSDVIEVIIPQQDDSKKLQNKKQKESKQTNKQIKDGQENQDDQWEDEQDNEDEEQDDEWSDVSEQDGEQQVKQMKEIKQQKLKPKTKKYVMYKPTVLQNGQLLLPNGKLLGNRKYRHLYKQYYRPIVAQSKRMLMFGAQPSSALVLKSQMIQLFKMQNKQSRVSKTFQKNRDLKLRLRQNKLQYHFRCQTPK